MHTNQAAGLVVGLLTAFACNCAAASEESDFGFSVGAEYSSGKYGSSNTTQILTLPVGVQYRMNEGLVSLTMPWISMTGFGDVTANGMRFKSPTSTKTLTSPKSVTESGLGDVTLAVSQGFYSSMDEQQHLSWGGK